MSKKQLNELFSGGDDQSPPSTLSSSPTDTDREGAMAKADLYKLAKYSTKLYKKLEDDTQLEAWVQAKITKAADYIASVYHYLEYEMDFSHYSHKLDNAEMMNESVKSELRAKLLEAKSKIAELKKIQALKLEEAKKSPKAKKDYDKDGKIESEKDEVIGSRRKAAGLDESWDDDDEDPDVKKADSELKKRGIKLPKTKADPDKDMSKLAKKSKKEDDLDESWDDDEDDDVRRADQELKKKGVKLPKVKGVDPDKDISKLAKKSKKEDDLDESWDDDDEDPDVKRADSELKKRGIKLPKSKADPDKDMSKLAKKSKKDDDLDESKRTVKEAVKKAKKDYDGDGKIESEKDEVWGSRMKAANKTKKETIKESFGLSGEKIPKMKRNDPVNQFTGDRPDIVLPYEDDWDLTQKRVITALRKKGIRVDGIDDKASPVIILLKHGKQVAWFDFENSYGYITSEYPGPIDEVSGEKIPKMKRNDPVNQFTGDRPDIVLPYEDDWDLTQKRVITALRKKGIRVDGIDDKASPVIILLKHGKQVAWFDFENSYGYITSEYPGPIDEVSDEENDVISAPNPVPPTIDPDGGSAPRMYESADLSRIKMLSGLK